jgi:hypothetical protein
MIYGAVVLFLFELPVKEQFSYRVAIPLYFLLVINVGNRYRPRKFDQRRSKCFSRLSLDNFRKRSEPFGSVRSQRCQPHAPVRNELGMVECPREERNAISRSAHRVAPGRRSVEARTRRSSRRESDDAFDESILRQVSCCDLRNKLT